MRKYFFVLLICCVHACMAFSNPVSAVDSIPAAAADVSSIDGIVAALYDVISGPAGQSRNWDRMRTLFIPEGRLIATGKRPDGTAVRYKQHPAME